MRTPLYRLLMMLMVGSLLLAAACDSNGRWSQEWEEKFESFQPSGKIMDAIGIEPGMVIGEIGAGNGRFAVKVAARVGPRGKVYANDIDRKAIRFMEKRCQREGIRNLVVIRSKEVKTGFPEGELDLVYLINTYDHLSDPVTLLRNTRPCLKPGGKLAVIASDPTKLTDHRGHAVAREIVIQQCGRAGFELERLDTSLEYDNIYVFRQAN